MKITIDEDIVKKHGYKLDEFLIMLAVKCCDEEDVEVKLNQLMNKNVFTKNIFNRTCLCNQHLERLVKILMESEKSIPSEEELIPLANQLRDLYPKGYKPSTKTPWKSSPKLIAKRLQKYFKIFGLKDYNTVIQATKEYVESFNGDYTFMRTLDYFILKTVNEDGENTIKSDLDTAISNLGENKSFNFDVAELTV